MQVARLFRCVSIPLVIAIAASGLAVSACDRSLPPGASPGPASVWRIDADGTAIHNLTGTAFPAHSSGVIRADYGNFDSKGLESYVRYEFLRAGGKPVATVYIFPDTSHPASELYNLSKQAISKLGYMTLERQSVGLPLAPGKSVFGYKAIYRYKPGVKPVTTRSELMVFRHKKMLVRVRLDYPALMLDEARSLASDLYATIRWPE